MAEAWKLWDGRFTALVMVNVENWNGEFTATDMKSVLGETILDNVLGVLACTAIRFYLFGIKWKLQR